MDKQMAKELLKTRKTVKRKMESLRSDAQNTEQKILKFYEPLTKPIENLILKVKPEKELKTIKKEEIKTPKKEFVNVGESATIKPERLSPMFVKPSTPTVKPQAPIQFLKNEDVYEDFGDESNDEDKLSDSFNMTLNELNPPPSPASVQNYLDDFTAPLPRMYIEESLTDTENQFDTNFGVRHNLTAAKFFVGDSEIDFNGPDIVLKKQKIRYVGTPGLYELLFKKQPRGYKKSDLDNYIDFGNRTNLFRRKYNGSAQINGNSSYKYKEIIEPQIKKLGQIKEKKITKYTRELAGLRYGKSSGSGIKVYNNKPIEYIHWDDPNELVERLKLLIASKHAGNTGHENEIISIIEELKEAKIIK